MKDDGLILAAWEDSKRADSPAILATVVKVSGSSYRSPGARMLITESGARTGSISGGCLESDVLKKAWWLTEDNAAALRVYDNTSEDDAIWEFGLGCNGVVHVLLERWEAGASPVTAQLLREVRARGRGGVLVTSLAGERFGKHLAMFPDGSISCDAAEYSSWAALACTAMRQRESSLEEAEGDEVFVEYIAPPPALVIAGAGHDAVPLLRIAKELGWHTTVIDGRSQYARANRFPEADVVLVADLSDPLRDLVITDETLAVVMSHSYEQDLAFVEAFLETPVRYLGVLGPRRRTERMLAESRLHPTEALHSPVGLDIGADTPEEIALAVVAEIQAVLAGREGGRLKHRAGPIHQDRAHPVPA